MAAGDDTGFKAVFGQYADLVKQGTQVDIKKISYTDPRFALYNNLQADAARFAKFREAQKQRELDAAKTDLDKERIGKKYKEYLKTEKQAIFANSAAAERWMGFQDNADIYPNLEYRTAGDSDVRAEHAKIDGLVLPINDDFWRSHTPPLGFGCRCDLVQTDDPVNKGKKKYKGFEETTAPKGFDFNPGIDQKLFSDTAGYYTSASKADFKKLTKEADSFVSDLSQKGVIDYMKKRKGTFAFNKVEGFKQLQLSNTDVKTITSGVHENRPMRNALFFDLKNVLNDADFVSSVAGTESGTFAKLHYYKVKGFDNMFLNIGETKAGELKLHAITDTINK